MKPIASFFMFVLRLSLAIAVFFAGLLIFFFGFDKTLLLSSVYSLIASVASFYGVKALLSNRMVKDTGLTRSEYKYIHTQLREGKAKINRLQKAMFSVRNVITIKQNYDVLRVAKKIQSIVEQEPKRFYQAEEFYYSHLDSMVELTEKYAFLTKQPAKTSEMKQSLNETRVTITSMVDTIEKDLFKLLNDDMETLHLELDYAKQSIERNKNRNPKIKS